MNGSNRVLLEHEERMDRRTVNVLLEKYEIPYEAYVLFICRIFLLRTISHTLRVKSKKICLSFEKRKLFLCCCTAVLILSNWFSINMLRTWKGRGVNRDVRCKHRYTWSTHLHFSRIIIIVNNVVLHDNFVASKTGRLSCKEYQEIEWSKKTL